MKKLLLELKRNSNLPGAALSILLTLSSAPAFSQALQFSNTSALEQENRFDISAGILEDAFFTIDDDLRGIFRYPFENSEATGLFLLGIGALVLADKPLTSFYQDKVEPVFDGFSLPPLNLGPSFSAFSRESQYVYAGIAGSYALGVALNDEKAQTAAVLATKAVAYSYLTSHVLLKSAIGRNRPVQNLSGFEGDPGDFTTDPLDFGNYHGVDLLTDAYGTAMPSFHTTLYFSVARVYAGVYDNYWVPYSLAGVLFASNIKGHRHWVSDMVAAAFIGTAIGEVVLDGHYGSQKSPVAITPYAANDKVGVYFSKNF
jgi:membrane-associated phospholipid phosphatase